MPATIISLTTIPPRFSQIGATLRDLLRQDVKIDEIRLNIARSYRRFPGIVPSLPTLPEGITVHISEQDYGPGTKLLPTLRDHLGKDTEILFCDDDQEYAPDWARRFLETRREKPNCCIVGKGYDFDSRPKGSRYFIEDTLFPRAYRQQKGLGYRLQRLVHLAQRRPKPFLATLPGYVHVLEAYRGALVRSEFFPEEVFDIPDLLWTVDDPWFSGHMARKNVPIWMMLRDRPHRDGYEAHHTERLLEFEYQGVGRLDADTACIDYFREHYGIWPGRKEVPEEVAA
ncbi:hypothetical protein SAMN05877809_101296 [Rhodobacter sp. JA431]|uniref:glycosyltransferase family A protein n=1 Tax=Rhodobacter sp. JA431 TaxID=570013 RepID=UPI000BCA894A|nr:glycosyltransferase family A protein [Rhodobacter sp. JA431]SOB91117.1 hypothetical protein SAMN05877809_101296 [Rhodobacter sp. JA431]